MPSHCKLISGLILILWCWSAWTSEYQQAWYDLQQLSSDEMAGRSPDSAGSQLAQRYLQQRFAALDLQPFTPDYQQSFAAGRNKTGVNLIGLRRGCQYPDAYIVVTAHYDHLPPRGKRIFNGADDNASGVAALLYLAAQTQLQCPAYSYVFLATDAEEMGLRGAKAFVAEPVIPLPNILFNLNLDMVSRGERQQRLYLAGKRTFPPVKTLLPLQQGKVKLQFAPEQQKYVSAFSRDEHISWHTASDHAVFYRAGVPYFYLGVGTHAQYHTPEDDWQRVDAEFFQSTLQLIHQVQQWLDQRPLIELQQHRR
jgi:Zn-dependent M28 family amino/carboxypeptidase